MSIQINGAEIGEIVQVAATVFSILLMIVCGWLVYLMVRPSRRVREQRRRERGEQPGEIDEMWRIMDRMDSRLEVLERAIAADERAPLIARRAQDDDEDRLLSPAVDGRESGGTK